MPAESENQCDRNAVLEEAAALILKLSEGGTWDYKATARTFATHIRGLKTPSEALEKL